MSDPIPKIKISTRSRAKGLIDLTKIKRKSATGHIDCCPNCAANYFRKLLEEPLPDYDEILKGLNELENDKTTKEYPEMLECIKTISTLIYEKPDDFKQSIELELWKIQNKYSDIQALGNEMDFLQKPHNYRQ